MNLLAQRSCNRSCVCVRVHKPPALLQTHAAAAAQQKKPAGGVHGCSTLNAAAPLRHHQSTVVNLLPPCGEACNCRIARGAAWFVRAPLKRGALPLHRRHNQLPGLAAHSSGGSTWRSLQQRPATLACITMVCKTLSTRNRALLGSAAPKPANSCHSIHVP